MKEIIKIAIAMAFMIGAYLLGYHQEDERHSTKLNEIKSTILTEKETLIQLQDSIDKLKHTIDSLKTKIEIEVSKKVKRQRPSAK